MRLRRNPKIEEAPLQGELMLFDPGSSKFFVLNRTMAAVWRHCDRATNLAEILRQEFADADGAAVEADLQEAINQLRDLGLLETEAA